MDITTLTRRIVRSTCSPACKREDLISHSHGSSSEKKCCMLWWVSVLQNSHDSNRIKAWFYPDLYQQFKLVQFSNWFLEHDITVFIWPIRGGTESQIMDVQLTNLRQLCEAFMPIWTKISEESFQHLVKTVPWTIKAAVKMKRGVLPNTSRVYLTKCP